MGLFSFLKTNKHESGGTLPSLPTSPDPGQIWLTPKLDGVAYAHKPSPYPTRLIEMILEYHDSTGGKRESVLDVGCGPGTATKLFAEHFRNAIGVDPSATMLKYSLKGKTRYGHDIQYMQADCDKMPYISDSGTDLLIAANSAHYFSPKWWFEAIRVMNWNATMALFTTSRAELAALPEHEELGKRVQIVLDQLQIKLSPYDVPANKVMNSLYTSLSGPGTDFAFSSPKHLWWKATSRNEIQEDIRNYAENPDDDAMLSSETFTVDEFIRRLTVTSSYMRMRESHDTAEMLKTLRADLKKAGWTDQTHLRFTSAIGLLLIKKRKRYGTDQKLSRQTSNGAISAPMNTNPPVQMVDGTGGQDNTQNSLSRSNSNLSLQSNRRVSFSSQPQVPMDSQDAAGIRYVGGIGRRRSSMMFN